MKRIILAICFFIHFFAIYSEAKKSYLVITGVWQDDDGHRYFLNIGNSPVWYEIADDELVSTFTSKRNRNNHVILVDESNRNFYKITDDVLLSISNQGKVEATSGEWLLKTTGSGVVTLDETTSSGSKYIVRSGDSLWAIAQRLCNNGNLFSQIASDNGLDNPDVIFIGQELVVRCAKNKKTVSRPVDPPGLVEELRDLSSLNSI